MSILLNIESSGPVCSVCVSKGTEILSIKETEKVFEHTEKITLLIEACMKSAELSLDKLDAISVSSGPGSYTALRVGVATAKGICYALGKPLIGVDTLQSLAGAAVKLQKTDAYYCPMLDARRMEVYTNIFDVNNQPQASARAIIISEESPNEFPDDDKPVLLFGNGAAKCVKFLPPPRFELLEVRLSAKNLVPLALEKFQKGELADLAYFSPFYLKSPNITKAKPKL